MLEISMNNLLFSWEGNEADKDESSSIHWQLIIPAREDLRLQIYLVLTDEFSSWQCVFILSFDYINW